MLHLTTSREAFFDQQITELEKRGVTCAVCVVPGSTHVDGGMPAKRGMREYARYFSKVRQALGRDDYDLIHANYGLTAPFAITQFRYPVVLTLWGSDVVGFDGLVTKACAWRADAVTVRSEEMRRLLGNDNAYLLPSGVDLELFRPLDRTRARQRVGWADDAKYVLFPYSQEYERKNYPLAERIVNDVAERLDTPVRLQTISGAPHENVPFYMNAADCLLLTSRREGSPNTVKEAMACDVPVVSTEVGDVKTRLHGVDPGGVGTSEAELSGLLFDVLEEPRRSNGREAVRDVSWDRIGERLMTIYQHVLERA